MNAHAPQYAEALKKAESFVRLVLSEPQDNLPDDTTVTKVARRIVQAMPPYDHGDIKPGARVVSIQ